MSNDLIPAASSTSVQVALANRVANLSTCSGIFQLCAQDVSCKIRNNVKKRLYCLRFFKEAILRGDWQLFNEREAEKCRQKLGWSYGDLAEFLLSLHPACFQKEVPNCEINEVEGYTSINSDQYHAYWDESNKCCTSVDGTWTVSLSLKIAVILDELGTLSGLVTLHTDR